MSNCSVDEKVQCRGNETLTLLVACAHDATLLRLHRTLDSNIANSWPSGDTTVISKQAESAQ